MRLLPLIAAATIGLFATAATAQNMNTSDPNSAPGASSTGGKVKPPSAGEVKKMDTTDPNSAPGASATGGKPRAGQTQNMDTVQSNPNRPPPARPPAFPQAWPRRSPTRRSTICKDGKSVGVAAAAPDMAWRLCFLPGTRRWNIPAMPHVFPGTASHRKGFDHEHGHNPKRIGADPARPRPPRSDWMDHAPRPDQHARDRPLRRHDAAHLAHQSVDQQTRSTSPRISARRRASPTNAAATT